MLHIAPPLLSWFHENKRSLPFREDPSPYHIWVSEVMLQQTRMTTVLPYYERFMEVFPTPRALAESDPDHLHKLWEGLGYYSRGDNLRRAAALLCEKYDGELPRTFEELRALPGIGDYTAGAIASISYQLPYPAVDGNVLRVFSRLYNDRADITLGITKKRMTERVMEELPHDTPGDFNQALMELGALICTPGEAQCHLCPLQASCAAYAAGTVAYLPAKAEKKPRRIEPATVLLIRAENRYLLTRRPNTGLLARMWQPYTIMESLSAEEARLRAEDELPGLRLRVNGALPAARHIFSHIEWHLTGWDYTAEAACSLPDGYVWASPDEMAKYAVPNAFKAYKSILYSNTFQE